jgi:hypothetical protein
MMGLNRFVIYRAAALVIMVVVLTGISTRLQADSSGNCGSQNITLPFNDVAGNPFFCQIAAAFFSGLTNGTTATTYSPTEPVSREQMAAFVTRTLDQSLRRGSQRAALQRFWTDEPRQHGGGCGHSFRLAATDGEHVWVANPAEDEVIRFSAVGNQLSETFTNIPQAFGVVALGDRVYVTGKTNPGKLFHIRTTDGAVFEISDDLGGDPEGITYDGEAVWTANTLGSISKFDVKQSTLTTFTSGFVNPRGILFDGTSVWVTDSGDNTLKRVNLQTGTIGATIDVGVSPRYLAFDGTNLWVPNFGSNSITVVRASTGLVVATLTGNELRGPLSVAFDGERIAVANNQGTRLSFWRATDLTPIFINRTANNPGFGICSDGVRFFVTSVEGCFNRL